MRLPEPVCVVRLTEEAVSDLHRLHRKDPSILRAMFKKMLVLERSPEAGEPLLGALVGFRKIVVGDRHWRIVWRVVREEDGTQAIDVSEVWAAGARKDSEVYEELKARAERLGGDPRTRPLAEVIEEMGRLYRDIDAAPELTPHSLPDWLAAALTEQLHLEDADIAALTQEQAQQMLAAHWGRPKGQ